MLSTATSTETVIEAKDLAVGYGGHAVLTGINFTVQSGEVFVISSQKRTHRVHMMHRSPSNITVGPSGSALIL
jgi:ABC-type histidine transport system ATPase subunit